MRMPRVFSRDEQVRKARGRLERHGFPRLQMLFLVLLTGAAGFVASSFLLHFGFTHMGLRYPVAVGVAYLVFLALLWIWLRTGADDYLDAPDLFDVLPARRSGSGGSCHQGSERPSADISTGDASAPDDSSSAFGDALGAAAEADEFAIPLIILVLVAALLLSSLFIVYSAPLLFAELLVDGALAASLYRRLRRLEPRHWLDTAFRRTVVPFLLTAAVVSACGWGLAQLVPDAHSIGQVLSHLNQGR